MGLLVLSVALEGVASGYVLSDGENASDVGGAAESPLEHCWQHAGTRVELQPCLERLLRDAEARLDAARVVVDREAAELDRVIGERAKNVAKTRESNQAWEAYRDAECDRRAEAMSPGTGSGDAYLACLIDLTESRRQALANP